MYFNYLSLTLSARGSTLDSDYDVYKRRNLTSISAMKYYNIYNGCIPVTYGYSNEAEKVKKLKKPVVSTVYKNIFSQ